MEYFFHDLNSIHSRNFLLTKISSFKVDFVIKFFSYPPLKGIDPFFLSHYIWPRKPLRCKNELVYRGSIPWSPFKNLLKNWNLWVYLSLFSRTQISLKKGAFKLLMKISFRVIDPAVLKMIGQGKDQPPYVTFKW